MANFTINSLANGVINPADSFVKSDSLGALTKVSINDITEAVVGDADLTSFVSGGKVSDAIAKIITSLTTKDIAGQVTANTSQGFTVGLLKYMSYGNVRQFYVAITTTSNIAQWSQLFTGLDLASAIPFFTYDDSMFNIESGKVVAQKALTSGKTYKIAFTYLV